jgi:hypothetical protein
MPTMMLHAAAEDGSNNGGEGDVRPRVETRGARKQAEREKRLPKSMPSASVCISFEASLWPKEDREFTDGVQEVFLDGCEEEDLQEHEDRDAVVRADGTWGRGAQDAIRVYEGHSRMEDADGTG